MKKVDGCLFVDLLRIHREGKAPTDIHRTRTETTQMTRNLFKLASATAAAASIALGAGAVSLITTAPASANWASCNTYGGMTNCSGSNGSSFNSYGNGNFSTFNGTTSGGNSYYGSCSRTGSFTSCSSY